MAPTSERSFRVWPRGHVRDNIILASFRADLRAIVNPQTGVLFTETEVVRATAPGSRFYIEADSLDLLGQAQQQRAAYFASQLDPRRANTQMLEQHHGRLWLGPNSRLPATGAGGPVRATGADGSVIPGSVNVPDPAAAVCTDPNGLRYQALESSTIVNGEAAITVVGIDTGVVTRLAEDTELRWSINVPPGVDPAATVLATFDGGFDAETDQDYMERVTDRIRERPASGNAAHFLAWSREASSAVGRVFVYPCALNAGTVLVALLEKRAQIEGRPPDGPNARVPSVATLNAVSNYLIPPASPVVPERVAVLVTGVQPQPSDLVLRLSLTSGKTGGWADAVPWPRYSSNFPSPRVQTVGGASLVLTVTTDVGLPSDAASLSGIDAPKLMLWNVETSRWARLSVISVVDSLPGGPGGRAFTITLASVPEMLDADGEQRGALVGDRLSPFTDRAEIIADAVENYFDSLGPGEVVAASDGRYPRAARQPATPYPSRAGQSVISWVVEALGGTAADAELTSISRTEPDLPTNVISGPNMITLGHVNVLPL